jgi:hypothetical protein
LIKLDNERNTKFAFNVFKEFKINFTLSHIENTFFRSFLSPLWFLYLLFLFTLSTLYFFLFFLLFFIFLQIDFFYTPVKISIYHKFYSNQCEFHQKNYFLFFNCYSTFVFNWNMIISKFKITLDICLQKKNCSLIILFFKIIFSFYFSLFSNARRQTAINRAMKNKIFNIIWLVRLQRVSPID